MKILLTGSNGFLGKYIYDYLSKYNSVYTLSRTNSNYCTDLSLSIPNFSEKFDLVIHAAGKAHLVPQNKRDIDSFININTNGTFNLIQGLNNVGYPKYFVFISSVSVYGIDEGSLINETFPLNAKDPYGKSKIEAEKIILKWCEDNNIICTILRLPLVVGVNPPGNLGYMIKSIKNRYYFNIDGGSARRSMVLASDVASFILTVANLGGIFNLTDGYNPSFSELSKVISIKYQVTRIFNMSIFIANIIAKIGDLFGGIFPLNSNKLKKINSTLTFDDSKARKLVGWSPNPVLDFSQF